MEEVICSIAAGIGDLLWAEVRPSAGL